MADLAPRIEERPLEFMNPDEKMPPASRDALKGAIKFAKAKRMDEACSRIADLYENDKDSIVLSYNKGFCDESVGEVFKADGEYRQASTLANAPQGLIDRHLTAVEKELKAGVITPIPMSSIPRGVVSGGSAEKPSEAELAKQRRVALVIGNSHYAQHALRNPVNDAHAVRDALTKIGFDVTEIDDANSLRFAHAVDNFVNGARGADAVLLYYSGHGFQHEEQNWLMPVDNGQINCLEDATVGANGSEHPWAVSTQETLGRLERSTEGAKILILDACRDSPFTACNRSASRGLSAAPPKAGSLIAYSTRPGMTAPEGRGTVSLFTKNFVKYVGVPDLTLEDVLKQVRSAVESESATYGQRQIPTEVGELMGTFYFKVSK